MSSEEDGGYEGLTCNTILYTGFGLAAVGLIVTFLGLGTRGFKTLEVKMLGPGLVILGVMLGVVRLLFCGSSCFESNEESEALLKKEKHLVLRPEEELTKFHSGHILLNHSRMYLDSV